MIRKLITTFVARYRRNVIASNVHLDMMPIDYIEEARASQHLTFNIYRRGIIGRRRWYFRVQANNNEVIAQSEGYTKRIDCYKAVYMLINAGFCTVQEISHAQAAGR